MNGAKLKAARKEVGLSLDQLARITGFGATTIARWERENMDPRFSSVCVLARALGKPMEHFCPDDEEAAA